MFDFNVLDLSLSYSSKWFSHYRFGSLASRGHKFIPPIDVPTISTDCGKRTFHLYDRRKDFTHVSGQVFVTPGHTSFMSAEQNLVINRGLTYRYMDEDSVLQQYAINCFGGKKICLSTRSNRQSFMIGGVKNYGHFVFEFFPKAVFALMHFGPSIDLLVNRDCLRFFPLIHYISRYLYDQDANIIPYDAPAYSYLDLQDIFFVESTLLRFPPMKGNQNVYFCFETLKFINECFSALFPSPSTPDMFIYSPRGAQAKHRLLSNSGEIRNYFKANGFQIIDLGSLSQSEQLSLMSRTRCLVTEAGAAGAIATFCPHGAHIVDLFPDTIVGGCASVTTTVPLRQKYTRVTGPLENTNTGKQFSDRDYHIPLSSIQHHPDLSYLFDN